MAGKYDNIDFKPPKSVRSKYRLGLKLHEEGKSGDGLEQSTVRQAKDIAAGKAISPEWARKGNRFWGRNERFLDEPKDSHAYVSALLWGGAPGRDWFNRLFKQMETADKKAKSNMINTRVSFFTNVGKTQITENDSDFVLRGVPVTKDDAVMNGLLYSKEHNKEGMKSLLGRVVTLSHPTNRQGEGASAYEGYSLKKHFSGGEVTNVYSENGIWKVDIEIAKHMLKAQDVANDSDFYERLENKEPIGVSTGLYTEVEQASGTNAEGKEYDGIATNQKYDHLAMLPENEPPAGGDDTYMRFNSEDQGVERMVVNLADYIKDENKETKEDKESKGAINQAIEGIRQIIESEFRAKVNAAYDDRVFVEKWSESDAVVKFNDKMMKAEISFNGTNGLKVNEVCDYMPESTYKRKEDGEDDDSEDDGVTKMLFKLLGILGLSKMFANKDSDTYNINCKDKFTTNEESQMADMKEMRAALQKAGKLKDEMSDEDVKNAYDKMNKDDDKGAESAKNADETNINVDFSAFEERLNAIEQENKALKAQVNAQSEAEKDQMINELEAVDTGFDKEDLEKMEVNMLKKLHDKHCSVTNSLGLGYQSNSSGKPELSDEL